MGDVEGSVTKVQEWLSRQMRGSQGPTQPSNHNTSLHSPEYYRTQNTPQPRTLQNPEYYTTHNTTERTHNTTEPRRLQNPQYYRTQNTTKPWIQRYLENYITLTEQNPECYSVPKTSEPSVAQNPKGLSAVQLEGPTLPQRLSTKVCHSRVTGSISRHMYQHRTPERCAFVEQGTRHCFVTVEQGTRHGSRCCSVSKTTTEPRIKYKGVPTLCTHTRHSSRAPKDGAAYQTQRRCSASNTKVAQDIKWTKICHCRLTVTVANTRH